MKLKNQKLALLSFLCWFCFGLAVGLCLKSPELWPEQILVLTSFALALAVTVIFVKKTRPAVSSAATAFIMLALSGWQFYDGFASVGHSELLLGGTFALIAILSVVIEFPVIWEKRG